MFLKRFSLKKLNRFYLFSTRRCLSRQTNDILLLKGEATTPYIICQNNKFQFKWEDTSLEIMKQYPVQFFTADSQVFHPLTPFSIILKKSFFFRYNQTIYYVIKNDSLINNDDNSCSLSIQYGGKNLQSLSSRILAELPEKANGKEFYNLMIKNIVQQSQKFELQRIKLLNLLDLTQDKLKYYEQKLEDTRKTIEIKAKKRVNYFIYLIWIELAVLNYCTYVYLSWDIVEPIVNILANFDALIAYYYFLMKKKSFDLRSLEDQQISGMKNRYFRKQHIDFNRYKQLISIKQNLKLRLALLAKDPNQIINQFKNKIVLLDTK